MSVKRSETPLFREKQVNLSVPKKLFFYIFMAVFMLAIMEGFAFVAIQLVDQDDFFDHREGVLQRLNEDSMAKFMQNGADPVLGWRSFGPRTRSEHNCQGRPVEYNYDATGARTYSGFDSSATRILIVGDSYTNGDEVDDDKTYPARLADLLGVSVANHGVGGYGPTQAVLNFSENTSIYSQADVVVLGIMYENLYRMVNSYRPVLYSTSSDYTLKPHMASGKLIPHPGAAAFSSLDSFMQLANRAFDTDFWAKPPAEFPYLVSLVKSLGSEYFVYRKLQKEFRGVGVPEYFLIFDDKDVKLSLVSLLNQYALRAKQAGLKPVAVFIPRNRLDTTSAGKFIEQHRQQIDEELLLGDVGQQQGVDWMKFNLQELEGDNICHPSAYGYQTIAEYIADFMRINHVWPAVEDNSS
jgi:hypothetical protein